MKLLRKKIFAFVTLVVITQESIAEKKRLIDYAYDMYSQNGEDGLIKKIFEIMGTTTKLAVEFGAWDGLRLSNTANLWVNHGWTAVLIESDKTRYQELVKNLEGSSTGCMGVNAYIGIDKENCIETILDRINVHEPIDLMSIDIDGNDYYIFDSLKTIRPRLIIIEYNPTIPVTMDIYAPYSINNRIGHSVGALNRIADAKGYKLIALTTTNAFYVLDSEFEKFKDFETELNKLNVNNHMVCITSYDGEFANISQSRVLLYGLKNQYRGELCGNYVRNDILRPVSIESQ